LQSILIEKGEVEKRDLANAPFTRIHPDGIRGVFSNKEIEEIILFIQKLAA
jgi:type I restriction enzyme, R subunit